MASIVLIDDSRSVIDMMTSILQAAGHRVTAFSDTADIENQLASLKPDLIMLDIVMPQRNGYEVLRAIKRVEGVKEIPVILVSSKGEETDIRWGMRQGAVAYITKPFTQESVLTTVRSFV